MKYIDAGLAAHLASGVTSLCWCWRLTRYDGAVMGFTDHDRNLNFDGTTFEAAAGFTASEIKDVVGLAVDNLEVTSALSSERLDERDLVAGLYDDARVEIYRVNWEAPSQRVLMRKGSLGEVRRSGSTFTAEVRGLAHYLQQPVGRLFQYTCDANLGDVRCGVDANDPNYRGLGSIVAASDLRNFEVAGLDAFANDWFTRGLIRFTSGAAAGQSVEIKRHTLTGDVVEIELWQPARDPVLPGQTFIAIAGCDKQHATCRDKYSNAINYRGFAHMPGNDFITAVARPGS
ncbi:MAG: DUF2163 domain-containing protein [Hyphomicrobiaceae bacterium]|nr:DUF2163 domain-containing protein [Hyphomicrobiaceae bacterium]